MSRTGKRNRPRRCRAFTLIELMLVMALLLIVISVAMSSLKNFFSGRNLDSEARRFMSLTRYGQSRAVSEGMPMVLWVDAQQGTYGLEAQAGYVDNDSKAVQYKVADQLTIQIPASGPTLLTHSNLWTQPVTTATKLPTIRFLPDGFIAETSPPEIIFRQGAEDAVCIAEATNGLTYEIQPSQSPGR